jgi:hypothetical protein
MNTAQPTRTLARFSFAITVAITVASVLVTFVAVNAAAAAKKPPAKSATKSKSTGAAKLRRPTTTVARRRVVDPTVVLVPITTLAAASASTVPATVSPPPTTVLPTIVPTTTAPDFEIRVAQPNQTIGRNEVATYTLFVDAGSGYGGSVILAISDLPPGTEAVYEPIPITSVGQVRIRTTDRTPNGTFAVKAIASTPRSSRAVTLVLTVVDGITSTTTTSSTTTTTSSTTTTIGTKTFAMQTNQVGSEIAPGKTIRVDVQIIPSGGFNEPIVLSVAGAPQGTSASFVKSPISIAETGQLFIGAAANANNLVAGTSTVTISAVGGGVTRTASITFTVKATA